MNQFRIVFVTIFLFVVPVSIVYADGGTLHLSPETGTYTIGELFDVQILSDSAGKSINAAEADITFDTDALEVESVSSKGSILNSWPKPPQFSNQDGTISFSGVASQKYSEPDGLLLTVTFKALQNMQGAVHFQSGAILAADGVETNIITTMRSGLYTVQPVEVPASTDVGSATSQGTPDATGVTSDASSASTTIAGSPDIPAPVLLNYQNQISAGDRIVVKGTAPAGATVSVWLQEGSDKPLRTDLDVATDGTFTFVSDTQAQLGTYSLWAFTQGAGGKESVSSNKLNLTAISTGAASVALFQSALISNIVPFTALLVFAGLASGYLFHRHKLEKFRIEQQYKS